MVCCSVIRALVCFFVECRDQNADGDSSERANEDKENLRSFCSHMLPVGKSLGLSSHTFLYLLLWRCVAVSGACGGYFEL